jgi:Ca2+-transporting ATPase
MTGDGVNDAVALNVADIGVAMGSGKDIAKDAAKLVLLDDNFTTIVAAIREGRVIRDNVRKVIGFLLATNAAEVAIFLASQILGLPLPLLPAQILWINLVTDGTSDIALSLEPQERNVMARSPESPTASLINKQLVLQIITAGLIMTVFTMALYIWGYRYQNFELTYMRTFIFSFVAVTALLSTWSYRSLWESTWKRGINQNPWLFASAGFSFALQLAAIYTPALQGFFHTTPLALNDWGIIILAAFLAALVIDIRKFIFPLPHGHK